MEKVILVTGGNRGIGLEICKQLHAMGHEVIMTARNIDSAIQVKQILNIDIDVQLLNVRKEKHILPLYEYIDQTYGKLDVLINNVGILGSTSGAFMSDMKQVKKVMKTNFYAPWRLTEAMLPLLKRSDDGRVVNISSGMGAQSELSGDHASYRISKSALNALTIIMADELSDTSIKINSMCPGWVRTDMGGVGATRSVEEGADTAVWLATNSDIPKGKFIRDRKEIPW